MKEYISQKQCLYMHKMYKSKLRTVSGPLRVFNKHLLNE